MLRTGATGALILASVLVSASDAVAATLNVCGTLQALIRPNPPQQEGPGSATIDGKTYRLSSALSANGTNTIGSGVAVGKRVCLSGEVEVVDATGNLINNYVLAECDQPSPPSGCSSAALSTLTQTATATASNGEASKAGAATAANEAWIFLTAGLGLVAVALLVVWRSRHV